MQVGQLYNVSRKAATNLLMFNASYPGGYHMPNNTLMMYIDTDHSDDDHDVHIVCIQEHGICYLYSRDGYVFLKVTCK